MMELGEHIGSPYGRASHHINHNNQINHSSDKKARQGMAQPLKRKNKKNHKKFAQFKNYSHLCSWKFASRILGV
jgi:hypothetical protein